MADTVTLSDGVSTITFDNPPVWGNYGVRQDITAERYLGMDGTENIVERARVSGYPIDLVMTRGTGWLSVANLASLRTFAAKLGKEMTLNYRGTEVSVRFRHEDGAIEVEPLDSEWNPTWTDCWFMGVIRLMTV